MADYDVFNGDADGICALLQLRNSEPRSAQLITGVKRDISLLKRVDAGSGDRITVLDISMDKNTSELVKLLDKGASVFYVDHHFPGDIPDSEFLDSVINEAPDTCTSILVNKHLKGQFVQWAIVGAFGDNLNKSARALADSISLEETEVSLLENLGIYINYNGYGSDLEDLHFRPDDLFNKLRPYANPMDFIRDGNEHFSQLENGYQADMAAAEQSKPEASTDNSAVYILPNEKWARRVSGVFSNDLANRHPDRAHAVLTEKANGNYLVSVRAPLSNKTGAVDLCRQFATGGGRAAAAGINDLPSDQLGAFIRQLETQYT
ncbi:DHH family phosphoesterase [Pseudomaricurvus alkylphenolicus]|uniref:DHHA1 domain-containing protein n=1 Tax=Pseudomaricurvus alkylphenolicus TaxID=1306991 RepID=UPI001422D83A|nr:DHHA1 domain-containing protein [Pseudomaricurvus alkylphenolicus]NIB38625.1 DHH family phosphoesterase [Pseudomaricurvus alkylphenolicus]